MKRSNEGAQSILSYIGAAHLSTPTAGSLERTKEQLRDCPEGCKAKRIFVGGRCLPTSAPEILGVYQTDFLLMRCGLCKTEWFLCMACGLAQRKRMINTKQLRDHKKNHSKRRVNKKPKEDQHGLEEDQILTPAEDSETPFICFDMPESEQDEEHEPAIAWSRVVNSHELGFISDKSRKYFEQCYLGKSQSSGMNYLAVRSSQQSDFATSDYGNQVLPEGHALLQTQIAKLAYSLTRTKNVYLAKTLHGAYNVGCENGYMSALRHVQNIPGVDANVIQAIIDKGVSPNMISGAAMRLSTRIPKNSNDIRSLYLEGARAIIPNLPIPETMEISGHAYCLVSECIRHFLALGDLSDMQTIPADFPGDAVNHSSRSMRAKTILQSFQERGNALPSYILFWSDDVEPNTTKNNRGSVWLLTMTIATHAGNGHSLRNTYPVAVGKKGLDHSLVIGAIENDLRELRNAEHPQLFYVGKRKMKVPMLFETFCTLQDSPEKRDFNYLRAGNGRHTGRFGVSANHGELYKSDRLHACPDCYKMLQSSIESHVFKWPLEPCQKCLCWDALGDNTELSKSKAPTDYPRSSPRLEPGNTIRPFRITYESLQDAIKIAHEGYVNGDWKDANVKAYLAVEGMNEAFITSLLDHASKALSLKLAKENPQEYEAILTAAEQRPKEYERIPPPCIWTRPTSKLALHPDVIMHLLFLGVVKMVVIKIGAALKMQSKFTSFVDSTSKILVPLVEMNLDWLPIQPYQKGKMGGWVSENYLGFARIVLWFFQDIDCAVPEVEEDPNLPQHKWLKKNNVQWLKRRGLDHTGLAPEVSLRVATYMQEGAPDPLPIPEITPASVENVLQSLTDMLQCVMAKEVTTVQVNRTRYCVRRFLSEYDFFTRPMNQDDKVPAVLSAYNFITLLNLPDCMNEFGPMRDLWEGGPRGEGFVRYAKPYMNRGFRKNWHRQVLEKIHRNKALDDILAGEDSEEKLGSNLLREHKGKLKLYRAAAEVRRNLSNRCPVSVLLAKIGGSVRFFAVVRTYDEVLEIAIEGGDPIERFGLHYYFFGAVEGDGQRWSTFETVTEFEFGVLLPHSKEQGNRFCLISSNWTRYSPSVGIDRLLD